MKERFKSFTVLMSGINRCIRRIKSEEMAEFNLKSPHVSCLYYLYREKELTAKQLCDICEEDKSAISRSLEFLEKNGYIVCNSELKKRYKSPLKLTEKGEEVGARIDGIIDKMLEEASCGLSDGNRVILYESLNLINNNLHKICEKYGD